MDNQIFTNVLRRLVIFGMLSVAHASTLTNSLTGNMHWTHFPNITLSTNLEFTFQSEFRGQDKHAAFDYQHNDIQAKYLIGSYVDVFTDYRLIFQNKGTGFKDESMLLEGFTLKYTGTNWGSVSLRSRIEIGFNASPTANTYYLNEFPQYKTPWAFTRFKLNPFVGDESYWDTQNDMNFVKNRIETGLYWTINSRIDGETSYYYEVDRGTSWTHEDLLVIKLNIHF